jgi:hypothetical protein
VLEAESQSECLDRRIRRHQSSSPESILEALKCLSKGTKAIMHENALLRAQVRDLQQANETLSRRRRAKRTRFQKGGVLTVREAREVIDHMNVDRRVEGASSTSGGQGGSARPRERRCGGCGKTGHNARTCQIVVAISEEEFSD